jgi:hypothetical protein
MGGGALGLLIWQSRFGRLGAGDNRFVPLAANQRDIKVKLRGHPRYIHPKVKKGDWRKGATKVGDREQGGGGKAASVEAVKIFETGPLVALVRE